ncbi:hypothetical protein V6N13_064055 [Hibiscus sabdariffa]|uniref:Uncharacterized protein n=2 Tax=Hibiscus sabdariffa TaxID=183260 RepID=A0ABR2R1Z4_9ROSI
MHLMDSTLLPRPKEILVLLEVTLYVSFVTSDLDNRLIAEVLYPGDVSVFHVGLIHFRFNIEKRMQLPWLVSAARIQGMITVANAVFRSKPHLNPDDLAKSFQLDKNVVTFRNGSGCLWVVVLGFKRSSKLRTVQ